MIFCRISILWLIYFNKSKSININCGFMWLNYFWSYFIGEIEKQSLIRSVVTNHMLIIAMLLSSHKVITSVQHLYSRLFLLWICLVDQGQSSWLNFARAREVKWIDMMETTAPAFYTNFTEFEMNAWDILKSTCLQGNLNWHVETWIWGALTDVKLSVPKLFVYENSIYVCGGRGCLFLNYFLLGF